MEVLMRIAKRLNKPARHKFLLLIDKDVLERTHKLAQKRSMSTTAYITEVLIENLSAEEERGSS
jgi:hypothetical protein